MIMVCIDGSDDSYRAADFAIALAKKSGFKILFVSVVGASTSMKEYNITADMVGSFQVMEAEALEKCRGKALEYGLDAETLLLAGDPADEILKCSKESKSTCIVMGRRGMGGAEKLLLGRVSETVLENSEIPVVMVK